MLAGTAAPVASITLPTIAPEADCASKHGGATSPKNIDNRTMIAINPVLTFVATVAALYERRQCNIIEIVDGRRPPLQLIFPITVLRIIECLSTLGLLSIER